MIKIFNTKISKSPKKCQIDKIKMKNISSQKLNTSLPN